MYSLNCIDEYRIPTREEVYVLDIIPFTSGPATISSDQKLSLFNPLSLKTGPTVNLVTSHGNITCARAFDDANSVVCTAGENGTISLWDLRQDVRQARSAQFTTEGQVPVLSIACLNMGYTIAAGTELQNHQASIIIWDVRSTSAPKLHYKEVHSDDVTELNFHPSDPNILLSGSTDGLINICDTRITDEDEVIIQTFNHDSSIHHAAFLNDTEVYAISHDERLALYDMAEGVENGAATTDFGDMRAVVGCQYIANIFAKANGAGAVIGAGAHEQQAFELIHLTKGDTWGLDRANSVGLPGAHSGEIVRSFCFYDEAQMVFSAGEDGFIKAWKPNV
ncbi:WD40-repeat-containing domain protein [Xylaria bambusicola]|uniref:WD40-repeat-containing domain protein n=1 Tax=Xylaria bambusicola TaxID=326684 RepID=UPI002007261E|nr:WD40-repeat-containing domain protein [Xylaria bambusicola]KAI0505795.1 WD40-repeat-containing domain protein [Xylaria bambusicola]